MGKAGAVPLPEPAPWPTASISREMEKRPASRNWRPGEANGCLTAATVAFDNAKKIKGLILVSPGFNPLEISRKAKRYNGTILVVDDAKGRKANLAEIEDFID